MANITQKELDDMIQQHEEWIRSGEKRNRPVFSGLDLSGLIFSRANLYHSVFLKCNLTNANFKYCNLTQADMAGSNLTKANLKSANLFRCNLYQAVLDNVKVNEYTQFYFQLCPEMGQFIGFKKAQSDIGQYSIVKLLIPEDAKRSSATTYRCRTNKAVILEIEDPSGKRMSRAQSKRNKNFIYKVGQTINVPNFDENRWHESAEGIHFYLSKELARLY